MAVGKSGGGSTLDLATVKRLKRKLEADFSAAVAPISVLESYCEYQPADRFAMSLKELPLRHLGEVMVAQNHDVIGQAVRGRPLAVRMSRIVAQSGEKTPPRMSVGYRLADNDDFAIEVRLQHADVVSLMQAQTLVNQHLGGSVPIGIISKVMAHSDVHPAAVDNDPLTLGSSIGHANGGPGTLGMFVQMGKAQGFLSCSHVLSNCGSAAVGDPIHHPASCDGIAHAEVAALRKFIDLRGDGPFQADAAFAEFLPNVKVGGNKIPKGYGFPSEGRDLGEPVVDPVPRLEVSKIGRSGYTTGVVALENLGPIDIYMPALGRNVTLDGLTEIHWTGLNEPFSRPGDSGSVVYLKDSLRPIGINVAGGISEVDGKKFGASYACPIGPILKALGLKPS